MDIELEHFFFNYPDFDIIEYKKLNYHINELLYYNNLDIIIHYIKYGKKENLLQSIIYFYKLYPNFELMFYKSFYTELNFDYDYQYISHYHYKGIYENKSYCIHNFISKNYIDIYFLKQFYKELYNKSDVEIVFLLKNELDNYIISNSKFEQLYPDFNLNIYKMCNKSFVFDNDIKYKSNWYFSEKDNLIYSHETFVKKNHDINIEFYKYIYNIKDNNIENILIDIYNNYDTKIYSYDTFMKHIDDFDYMLFSKTYNLTKKNNKSVIIHYYINNILKINMFFSEKIFYIKYPLFNIEQYKYMYKLNDKNMNIINDYHLLKNKINVYISFEDFYFKNPKFNIKLYKYHLNLNNIVFDDDNKYIQYFIKNNDIKFYNLYNNMNINIFDKFNVPFLNDLYKIYNNYDKNIYKYINKLDLSEEDLFFHYYDIGIKENLICNISMLKNNNIDFNIKLYRELNKDLYNLDDYQLFKQWYENKDNCNRIHSIDSFKKKYPQYIDLFEISENNIIKWMNNDIYKYIKKTYNDDTIIGRKIVNDIYEVLIDLNNPLPKEKLKNGISLVIRAKNEECNIKECIESVIDLVDEIIFVDNNSSDNTYSLVEEYSKKYNKIKLYQYNINVNKVGIEHELALKKNDKNTLATFYNWCLSKVSKYNVFKWDADFLCIENNFKQFIEKYNLRNRGDKFAIWFTGNTLFENNYQYYLNINSYYNEYRVFSYKNNFCWYDGNTCEYTEPYLNSCKNDKKYIYNYPLFYEIKRTSIDEFKERSSLIDIRDINDYDILNNLKNNINHNLIKMNHIFLKNIKMIIFTPSLSLGGGNQFIINLYKFYKSIGFDISIIPLSNDNIGKTKFNIIENNDIKMLNLFDVNNIIKYNPQYIIFNSSIPFSSEHIESLSYLTKIIFITHSDVAFSNSYVEKYHNYFFKIITVNDYTIKKMTLLLNIDKNKFFKLINYSDLKNNNNQHKFINKSFGIISRFSEDKNIPMLIISLVKVFNKYPEYKCYLIGTHNENYDNYLKYLCKIYNLNNNIIFKGYQNDVTKFYEILDFIILPSVSEGCSYNIIESMSYGIPVVCSDVGGNNELIKNNINGIIFEYTNIKNYEKKTIFVTSYNQHLNNIGYFINDDDLKNNYDIINDFNKIDVLIPYSVSCKLKSHNNNTDCIYCKNLNKMKNLFYENVNKINSAIIEMIKILNDQNLSNQMSYNNIHFINTYYNKYIYTEDCLNILN